MSITSSPESPDLFLEQARKQVTEPFSQLTVAEQVRVLRQLLLDLHLEKQRHWKNIFQYEDFVEGVSAWLDTLQRLQQRDWDIDKRSARDGQREETVKGVYEEIKKAITSEGIGREMRWDLFDNLFVRYVKNFSQERAGELEERTILHNLKTDKLLYPR